MSSVTAEGIKQEIGYSWYTIKVDGTKDPIGAEIISIIIRFNEHSLKGAERFLVLSSTDLSDAKSITDVILAELAKARLTLSKIPSQVYDGASVIARYCGTVEEFNVYCRNEKTERFFMCNI